MREYISEVGGFEVGIKPYIAVPADEPALELFTNLRLSPEGVQTRRELRSMVISPILDGAIYPRLLFGKQNLIYNDGANLSYMSPTDGSLTPIDVENLSGTTPADIKGSNVPHLIDHGGSFCLVDSDQYIYYDKTPQHTSGVDKAIRVSGTDAMFRTGTSFGGRTVIGDFKNFAGSVLQTFIEGVGSYRSEYSNMTFELPKNFIMWSPVGNDIIPYLFDSSKIYGNYDDLDQDLSLKDMFDAHGAGFMPMTFKGQVMAMGTLGDKLLVYGGDGISILSNVIEPEPTLSLAHLSSIGIRNRDCLGIGDGWHIFIDNRGIVWEVNGEFQLKERGYAEVFGAANASPNSIQYLPSDDSFYLEMSDTTYIINRTGMAKDTRRYLGVGYAGNNGVSGINTNMNVCILRNDDPAQSFVEFETSRAILGTREHKMLEYIRLESDVSDTSTEVRVAYRYSPQSAWAYTSWKTFNNEGYCFLPVSCLEFKLHIRAAIGSGFIPYNLGVAFKLDDKRYKRGIKYGQQTQ